jgi:hypothetical protein
MSWLSDLWHYGFTPAQRKRSRAVERYVQQLGDYERTLAQVSLADARAQADHLLATPTYFRTIPWDRALEAPPVDLAPGLRTVFTSLRRIEALNGEPYIDVAELAPYQWASGYWQLGTDSEHAFLVVRPAEETVYVFDETEPPDPNRAQRFPSVHHWLLWLHRSGELLAASRNPAA